MAGAPPHPPWLRTGPASRCACRPARRPSPASAPAAPSRRGLQGGAQKGGAPDGPGISIATALGACLLVRAGAPPWPFSVLAPPTAATSRQPCPPAPEYSSASRPAASRSPREPRTRSLKLSCKSSIRSLSRASCAGHSDGGRCRGTLAATLSTRVLAALAAQQRRRQVAGTLDSSVAEPSRHGASIWYGGMRYVQTYRFRRDRQEGVQLHLGFPCCVHTLQGKRWGTGAAGAGHQPAANVHTLQGRQARRPPAGGRAAAPAAAGGHAGVPGWRGQPAGGVAAQVRSWARYHQAVRLRTQK